MNKILRPVSGRADGILFDKDGTLFDFHMTWNAWAGDVIRELASGDPELIVQVAGVIDFDLDAGSILPSSIAIAETNRHIAEAIATVLPDRGVDDIEQFLVDSAASAPLSPAVPLAPFLAGLVGQGLALGVMTNDSEYGARAHLRSAGVEAHFSFVAGFDSGFGAKPAPDPLLAFARSQGLTPSRVAMVGDSIHDLMAGRAAGMQTVGVLTGPASGDDLAPFADMVLPDIGHLPGWLST
ncbi:Phosphoglycolate phosphatase [Roseovarius litorisediminis]|uniref:phosphoglycolate phosphatase n=1 Tax=Roseovarius litorisediminis TaxID=1312363 RepID=A0A1Y5RU46_9RHOB|nr:HAD family hydrolase [Roseovarius litorisediminis]SLN25524.1 Phosphoglycolate phosphatase [Roseovarius litorisediminis]